MNTLPNISTMLGGKHQPFTDLSNDIPKLMEYIQAFDDATADTIKQGEATYEYGYYGRQLDAFIEMNPNFDSCLIPNKELQRVLSGLYSDNMNIRNKANREIKKKMKYYY